MLRFNAEVGILRDQVIVALVSDSAYLDALFASPAPITTVCAKHILVGTSAQADYVLAQLAGGADFAVLADQVSDDAGPGGDLGCRQAAEYVGEFADATLVAPLNEVFGPVETEFGFHIILVSERTMPTREEIIADPVTNLSSGELNGLWQEWFNAQLQAAVVDLEPEYGTWSPVGILPPE